MVKVLHERQSCDGSELYTHEHLIYQDNI